MLRAHSTRERALPCQLRRTRARLTRSFSFLVRSVRDLAAVGSDQTGSADLRTRSPGLLDVSVTTCERIALMFLYFDNRETIRTARTTRTTRTIYFPATHARPSGPGPVAMRPVIVSVLR